MFLNKNSFCIIPNAVPTHICDKIVKYGNEHKQKMAVTGNVSKRKKPLTQKEIKDLKKHRNSRVTFLNDWWIQRHIFPAIQEANVVAKWNLSITGHESMQFTKYNKGQFYDWHCDGWDKPYWRENPNDPSHGKIRKLSVTVSLSDPKDYKGGELEFDFRNLDPDKKPNIKKCTEILPKGSLVVFPGFVWHRVCPVKKGSRYSLVIWNLGWPFR